MCLHARRTTVPGVLGLLALARVCVYVSFSGELTIESSGTEMCTVFVALLLLLLRGLFAQ